MVRALSHAEGGLGLALGLVAMSCSITFFPQGIEVSDDSGVVRRVLESMVKSDDEIRMIRGKRPEFIEPRCPCAEHDTSAKVRLPEHR
ncbi:hypothetical protein BV401_27840 [Streptomyces malaysiensis subsp. malaysiensis]|uniref:Uncharacterized protein n=1 Tax=Streptomyces autolyticus TaxID=75293 RepID=A0ABN4W8Q2_9ACTN|nr:hypothetical protein BV401_27840 [Streptomyces autolyticus]